MYRQHKTLKAIRYILDHLRKEDKEELAKLYGKDYKKQVVKNHWKLDFDILYDKKTHKPFLMGGINQVDKNTPDIAGVWLLSTSLFSKHKYKLAKLFLKELKAAQEKYFYIFNNVYKTNVEVKKFTQKLGFKILPTSVEGWEHVYITKKMKGLS